MIALWVATNRVSFSVDHPRVPTTYPLDIKVTCHFQKKAFPSLVILPYDKTYVSLLAYSVEFNTYLHTQRVLLEASAILFNTYRTWLAWVPVAYYH